MFQKISLPIYVRKNCPLCGKAHEVMVYAEDFDAWQNGDLLAQEAFPYLTVTEREILISGICPDCWDKMFSEEEEEDCAPGDCEVCDCRDFCGEATL